MTSTLIAFGGLPGTGKTTVARLVASRLAAIYLRIDAIEQAIRNAGVLAAGVGASGYAAAEAITGVNLVDGRTVVADCVNPVAASREGWRAVAARTGARLVEVEIICSDADEHRRRVVTRTSDIPGFTPPSWDDVVSRAYEPWDRPHVVIDTAHASAAEAVDVVIRSLPPAQLRSVKGL
jgi:predicted kinase